MCPYICVSHVANWLWVSYIVGENFKPSMKFVALYDITVCMCMRVHTPHIYYYVYVCVLV